MPESSTSNATSDAPNSYLVKLELFDRLRKPLICEALYLLGLPRGSHGLDAGCGAGLHLEPLLKAISPGGSVTGVDLSSDLLRHASALINGKDLAHAIQLTRGDLNNLPFEQERFDWLWSVDCAGYVPGRKAALVTELARVLKPGGRLVLMAYSSQQLLPGYPGLEARLNSTEAGQLPFSRPNDTPEDHFMRLQGHLKRAGYVDLKTKSFLAEFNGPLDNVTRKALLELMDMRWGAARDEMDPADWDLFSRLSQPDSPEFILDISYYHGFFTYTMFTGVKPA